MILALMRIFLDDSYAFRFADGKKLKEKFLPLFNEIRDCLNVNGLNALNAEGSLWGNAEEVRRSALERVLCRCSPRERDREAERRHPSATTRTCGSFEALWTARRGDSLAPDPV